MFILSNLFAAFFLMVTSSSYQLKAMEPTPEEEAQGPITLRALLIGSGSRPQIPWQRPFQGRGYVPYDNDSLTLLNAQSERIWQEIAQKKKPFLESSEATSELPSELFLAELRKAEDKFIDSYVHMLNHPLI